MLKIGKYVVILSHFVLCVEAIHVGISRALLSCFLLQGRVATQLRLV